MKTITILLASLLTISSQAGFAESVDLTGNCCPVSSEATMNVYQKQQVLLDQLQFESETANIYAVTSVHELVQEKVKSKNEEQASMNHIQIETENMHIESLQILAQKVNQHVNRETSMTGK